MKDFYNAFYTATEHSQVHRVFCERVFGKDLCQHGFADLEQLQLILQVTKLGPAHRALDLGCGNGMIAEYLSDCSGARITGLDIVPQAVHQARQRTAGKSDRLDFIEGDINHLELPINLFDIILSIDSMYFSENLPATLQALKKALLPGGQMAILYSHGREPWIPKNQFPKETLPPDKTPLAQALQANDLAFRTWDLTRQDYELAKRRKQVLADLKLQFEVEGAYFIYENRMSDADGICRAVEDGLHARYLYHVQVPIP